MFEGITPWQIPVYSDGYRPADDDELMNVFYDDIKEDIDPWNPKTSKRFLIMFTSDLRPMFGGAVLMNETATKDKAVMAALTALAEDNFTYRSHPSGTWYISDRH